MKILDYFLDLLFPPRCVFCRRLTHDGERICISCCKNLPYVPAAAQKQSFPHVSVCVSPLYYEGSVREALLRYKFQGASSYAKTFGEIIGKCIDENGFSCDIITWVPLSRRRLRKRGYDQTRLLAEELSRESGVPLLRLLDKTRHTPAQSRAGGHEQRKKNIAGAYSLAKGVEIKGKTVLLIDDIVTTGATISECARVLKQAGAKAVYAAALACHRP